MQKQHLKHIFSDEEIYQYIIVLFLTIQNIDRVKHSIHSHLFYQKPLLFASLKYPYTSMAFS